MEVQTLIVPGSNQSNFTDKKAIILASPKRTTIPFLDALSTSTADVEAIGTEVDNFSIAPTNAIGAITLNVAGVFGEVSNDYMNNGQEVHFIQNTDGNIQTMYNEPAEADMLIGLNSNDMIQISSTNTLSLINEEHTLADPDIQQCDHQSLTVSSAVATNEENHSTLNILHNTKPENDSITCLHKELSQETGLPDSLENQHAASASNETTVVIDVSNPIQLCQNSLIVVNGQKCVLQQNTETGQLIAYPVKEPDKPQKRRGRPRKTVNENETEKELENNSLHLNQNEGEKLPREEEATEKGLIERANEVGEIVKRSTRKRKKTSLLEEYETGAVKFEGSSDDEHERDHETKVDKSNRRHRIRGRGKKFKHKSDKLAAPLIPLPSFPMGKRGRGRPRRYGLKPPEPPATQAFLIQMSDGQTVMIHVPTSQLPTSPGVSLQDNVEVQQTILTQTNPTSSGITTGVQLPPPDMPEFSDKSLISESSLEHPNNELQLDRTNVEYTDSVLDPNCNEDTKVEHDDAKTKQTEKSTEAMNRAENQMDSKEPQSVQAIIPVSLIVNKDMPVVIGLKATENELEKFKCPRCDFQAYYQQQYQDHIASHESDVQKCKCCSFLAFTEEELFSHYKEQHPKSICSICNYTAEHAYVIKRHMYRHNESGSTCEMCGKTYKDHYILRMHIRMVHLPAEVLFECSVCSKKFTRKAHLKRHLRTHNPDKPYKCPQCDYRGCERSDITKHRLIHEEPKHVCEVCGKTFRHIRNKELHVKRHNGQRDYKCGVCEFYGYTFTDIRKHIERKHGDSRTILCNRCGQAFKTEELLQEHQESVQCEIYMLEQAMHDSEKVDGEVLHMEKSEIGADSELMDATDSGEISSITLTGESIASLSATQQMSGQIVTNSELPNSQILDCDNNTDDHHSMMTEQTNEPLTIVNETEGDKQIAVLTHDGQMLSGVIMDCEQLPYIGNEANTSEQLSDNKI